MKITKNKKVRVMEFYILEKNFKIDKKRTTTAAFSLI